MAKIMSVLVPVDSAVKRRSPSSHGGGGQDPIVSGLVLKRRFATD
jgi:hypothetical protein